MRKKTTVLRREDNSLTKTGSAFVPIWTLRAHTIYVRIQISNSIPNIYCEIPNLWLRYKCSVHRANRTAWTLHRMNIHDLFLYLKYYSPFLAHTSGYAVYDVGLSRSLARIAGLNIARRWGWKSLVSDVFCQVEFSASVWSLVQRSPTECGTSVCGREVSITRKPCPTTDCWAMGKI
jgi:hypothetical protein